MGTDCSSSFTLSSTIGCQNNPSNVSAASDVAGRGPSSTAQSTPEVVAVDPTAIATDVPPTATPTMVPTATETPTQTPTALPTSTIEPTATLLPTDTPEPRPTSTPKPTSCDEIDGGCLMITFVGQTCIYDGPDTFAPERTLLIYFNTSRHEVTIAIHRLNPDKTAQDVIDQTNVGMTGMWIPESWTESTIRSVVPAGQYFSFSLPLQSGSLYSLVCSRSEPGIATWYGGSFTVTD